MEPAFTLASPETGTEYRIFVEAPDAATEPGPWPALAFLDGDDLFTPALDGYRAARAAAEIPPLLLVGVGYGASFGKPGNERVRDYTPSPIATEKGSGGSRAFREFLRGTLWPELLRRHPVRPDVRILGGHSLGSLLVLDALFQVRPAFTHFLASAPSLWWDERVLLGQAARLRKRQGNLPGRAYLSAGTEDSESMLGDLELLEDQLSSRPFAQLAVTFERIAGRNHYDVLPDAVRAGLRALLPADAGSVKPVA
jgi:predicted alpha/beta superfamily hydrolase